MTDSVDVVHFVPENDLELRLVSAKTGTAGMQEFVEYLLDKDLFVPSGAAVEQDGTGFVPVLFHRERPMLAVFTGLARVKVLGKKAPYCLSMKTIDLLKRIPPAHGVVLNPGFDIGMEISPEGIAQILAHAKRENLKMRPEKSSR